LLGLLVGVGGGRRRDEDADGPPVVVSSTPGGGLVAAVPLVLALSAWGTLLASPVENTISRQIETRADVDALETTHDPDAFIAMQKQLAVRGLGDPTPPAWSQFWFGSHPTSLERVAIAERLGR
jgi:STE24 endopeptidase